LTGQPKIDDLSQQIVDMMEERKNESAHDRLYKIGKEKIRTKTLNSGEVNIP
jgi:hypothetical protein